MISRWILYKPGMTVDHLGLIPTFLSEDDTRPAREQFDENYAHGGGWQPFTGFKLNVEDMVLTYPNDPPIKPLAGVTLHIGRSAEHIYVYPHAWVLIMKDSDMSWEVCRMD